MRVNKSLDLAPGIVRQLRDPVEPGVQLGLFQAAGINQDFHGGNAHGSDRQQKQKR